jgi:hypothetical protein
MLPACSAAFPFALNCRWEKRVAYLQEQSQVSHTYVEQETAVGIAAATTVTTTTND